MPVKTNQKFRKAGTIKLELLILTTRDELIARPIDLGQTKKRNVQEPKITSIQVLQKKKHKNSSTVTRFGMCCPQLHGFSVDMRAEVLDPCTQSGQLNHKSMWLLILPRTVDRRRTLSAADYRFPTPAFSIVGCIASLLQLSLQMTP